MANSDGEMMVNANVMEQKGGLPVWSLTLSLLFVSAVEPFNTDRQNTFGIVVCFYRL